MASRNDSGSSTGKGAADSITHKHHDVDHDTELDASPQVSHGQDQTYTVSKSRKLGIIGAIFIIINKIIGTGIFSTPSGIFGLTGSVGISIFLWVIGGLLTAAGLAVYLEFGLAIPRSGGEKNYLERVYRRPKLLATCMLAAQLILLGFSSGNSLAFGRYVLFASGSEAPDGWAARGIGIACVTFCVSLHAFAPRAGIWLSDILGVFKVVILLLIVFSGFAALGGHRKVPDPHNFDHSFRQETGTGYAPGGVYNYATALLRIFYSFKGWENANYVLSEVKNPRRTLRIAAPLAVTGVTVLYVLANVAYFAAIPKSDLVTSEVLVAGLFFRNMFGPTAGGRALPAFVALSNLGNVIAVSFAHSRVNQEFAKEGLLPFSRFWASNKPLGGPAAALFLHWLVTVIVLVAPPAGPAYEFIVDLYTYPGTWINSFVSGGLIYLHFAKHEGWESPFKAWLPAIVLFLLVNVFLAIVPFIPPVGDPDAAGYPFYVFPIVGVGVLLLGALYWAIYRKLLPRLLKYEIVAERYIDADGDEHVKYKKVKLADKVI